MSGIVVAFVFKILAMMQNNLSFNGNEAISKILDMAFCFYIEGKKNEFH